VVREFTGHGIGTSFHSGLIIPHYDEPRFDDEIRAGMTFTIEPMLNLGTHEWVMWDDNWTVVTADGRPSAQFEHTLLVTADGAEVLTNPQRRRGRCPPIGPVDDGFRRPPTDGTNNSRLRWSATGSAVGHSCSCNAQT
jgi:hypothetical protein